MDQTFNLFDIAFFFITFLFAFSGFVKGFVKIMASLLIWAVAIAITYLCASYVTDFLSNYSSNSMINYAAARLVLFVLVFFLLSIAVAEPVNELRKKLPASFDRSFGFLFGMFKSLLIFSIFYSALYNIYDFLDKKTGTKKEIPSWIINAKTASILKISSSYVDPMMKSFVTSVMDNFYKNNLDKEALDQKIDEISTQDEDLSNFRNLERTTNQKNNTTKNDEGKASDSGYSKKDIEKMKRLIEIVE